MNRAVRRPVAQFAVIALVLSLSAHGQDSETRDLPGQAEHIERLVWKLGSEDLWEREEAQAELIGSGPSAYEVMRSAMTSPDPEVRHRAREIIEAIIDNEVNAGFGRLREGNFQEAEQAAREVLRMKPGHGGAKEILEAARGRRRIFRLILAEGIEMHFVWMKPGKFQMGSERGDEDGPVHWVTISKGFWMQTTEVTQAQWEAVMGTNPSQYKGDANRPVERVTWRDCQEFFAELTSRYKQQLGGLKVDFPTEAEWEYACRAGSEGKWCFGDDEAKVGEYAWYDQNSGDKPHPAGQKKPNAWGLYDMHGNVWEWCSDWYGPYAAQHVTDPQGPVSGRHRSVRGGWWNGNAEDLQSARRSAVNPTVIANWMGVRATLR